MSPTTRLSRRDWLLIATLSLLTFVLGTSEFVIVGILAEISSALNITIATAGTLVSAFAISFAIGTPIVMSLTGHLERRRLILRLLLVWVLLNLASSFAPSYEVLLATRILTAILTGVLISLAMVVASDGVPVAKRGVAVSFIFGGFTLANVLGVPIGTFIGQHAGFAATFWLTTVMGMIAVHAVWKIVPVQQSTGSGSIKEQLGLLANPRILIAFFIPSFGFGATYVVYTYLVPILQTELGIAKTWISPILLAYGVVSIFSNILAGKIASKNPMGRLRFVFVVQAIVLAALYFTTVSLSLGLFNIALMSLMSILLTTSTQIYLIDRFLDAGCE